jgi:hypothetical protein
MSTLAHACRDEQTSSRAAPRTRLTEARELCLLTVKQAAELSPRGPQTISIWEHGGGALLAEGKAALHEYCVNLFALMVELGVTLRGVKTARDLAPDALYCNSKEE